VCPCSCEVCVKSFCKRSHLKEHLCLNCGEHPHACEVCNKSLCMVSRNECQSTHTGVCLYSCEACGKSFHQENHLKEPLYLNSSSEHPHSSIVCNKSFRMDLSECKNECSAV
jgi:KRAB domain-containing zinc finger protein